MDLVSVYRSLTRQVTNLECSVSAKLATIAALDRDLLKANLKVDSQQNEINTLKDELAASSSNKDYWIATYERRNREAYNLQDTIRMLEGERDSLQRDNDRYEQEIVPAYVRRLDSLLADVHNTEEHRQLDAYNGRLLAQIERLEAKLAESNKSRDYANDMWNRWSNRATEAEEKVKDLERTATYSQAYRDLEAENGRLSDQLEESTTLASNYKETLEQIQSLTRFID